MQRHHLDDTDDQLTDDDRNLTQGDFVTYRVDGAAYRTTCQDCAQWPYLYMLGEANRVEFIVPTDTYCEWCGEAG